MWIQNNDPPAQASLAIPTQAPDMEVKRPSWTFQAHQTWHGEKPRNPTDSWDHSLRYMAPVKISQPSLAIWVTQSSWNSDELFSLSLIPIPDTQNPKHNKCCLMPLSFRVVCSSEIDRSLLPSFVLEKIHSLRCSSSSSFSVINYFLEPLTFLRDT